MNYVCLVLISFCLAMPTITLADTEAGGRDLSSAQLQNACDVIFKRYSDEHDMDQCLKGHYDRSSILSFRGRDWTVHCYLSWDQDIVKGANCHTDEPPPGLL